MSDRIGHECGLTVVSLRNPLDHYRATYGDVAWGLRHAYLLMQKQYNRGQDGAGLAVVKRNMPPGEPFLQRIRSDKHNAIERIFDTVMQDLDKAENRTDDDPRRHCEFLGETYLGHLRYGTHSSNALLNCHPLVRTNSIASRNLAIAGNFNMTNAQELFQQLLRYGLNPVGDSDTQVILEKLDYFLDEEHRLLAAAMGPGSLLNLDGPVLARRISEEIDLVRVLRKSSKDWDGGYVFGGLLGNGDAFVCRDPHGIRPAFWFMDDDVIAVASERGALANVFNQNPDAVEPIPPGHVLVARGSGEVLLEPFTEPGEPRQCTFERIYFSRGNDPDIYNERKALGRSLAPRIMSMIDGDLEHTIFSYVPNTAETAFIGLTGEIEHLHAMNRAEQTWRHVEQGTATREELDRLATGHVRAEKLANKDQRLRTFITHDAARRDLVLHIYDITRGIVEPDDTLVVLDDSIVRGTTLREAIITILSRLEPRRIIIASSAPPILYPDCYGIDMSQLGLFIGFEAAVALLEERGEVGLLDEIEVSCRTQVAARPEVPVNNIRALYDRFTLEELSAKIAQLVRPADISWDGRLEIVYQTIEGLRAAIPGHTGDWYFTGDYPTPGGFRVLDRSFLNWREGLREHRAY